MDKKYAIFDMDGTLVDSMPKWRGLGWEFLRRRGVTEVPPELLARMRHRTMVETGQMFIDAFHLEGTAESVAAEINGMMAEHYRTDVELKEGVIPYLEKLKARGVRMCIASATAKPLQEICLERLGLRPYFEEIFSCMDIGVGKASPDIYNLAAEYMGCRPEEAAVYEDAFFAGQTAKNAGYYLAAIYDETASEQWEQLRELADESFRSWTEAE